LNLNIYNIPNKIFVSKHGKNNKYLK
jgi:hypothetical protein